MKSSTNFILSLVAAIVAMFSIDALANIFPNQGLFIILGYDTTPGFIVKGILYCLSVFSLLEMLRIHRDLQKEANGLNANLLISKTYSKQNLNELLVDIEHKQRRSTFLLLDLIESVCRTLINSHRIAEGFGAINAQLTGWEKRMNSQFTVISTISGSLIGVGLIGSLIGISFSLGDFSDLADSLKVQEALGNISNYLSSAWNTTLIAFCFNLVLKYVLSRLHQRMIKLSTDFENYVIEHLLSRMEMKKVA